MRHNLYLLFSTKSSISIEKLDSDQYKGKPTSPYTISMTNTDQAKQKTPK